MTHDEVEFNEFINKGRAIHDRALRDTPSSLDAKIKSMARRLLEENSHLSPNVILRGNYISMAAADSNSGGAAVLIDKDSCTELSVWVVRGMKHSYLVEIRSIDGKKSSIEQHKGCNYAILVDGETVHRGVIDDDHVSESIELDENRNEAPRWSFEVYKNI